MDRDEKWLGQRGRVTLDPVKTFLLFIIVCWIVLAALFAPLDRTRGVAKSVARLTAHGLRMGWDWVTAVQPPAKPPAKKAAARRVSREGIVAQPPKEKLSPSDKDALDGLVRR